MLHHGEVQDFVDFRAVHVEEGVYVQLHREGAHVHGDQLHNAALSEVFQIDQRGSGTSSVELAAGRVARISQDNTLRLLQDPDDELRLTGEWELMAGALDNGEYVHRLSDGGATLLLSNGAPWKNPLFELDVDGDKFIDAQDVQAIVNHINRSAPGEIPGHPAVDSEIYHVDASGDQLASSSDVLLVVNHINQNGLGPVIPASPSAVHGAPHEVPAGVDPPTIQLEVAADPLGGWNAHVELNRLTLTPANASSAHVFGQGHLHLYINGEKAGRIYSQDFYIADLPEGSNQVAVEVSGDDHGTYTVDGQPILATQEVVVLTGADPQPRESVEVDAALPIPSIDLEVTPDAISGWNVRVATSPFDLSRPDASAADTAMKGYAVLLVDGVMHSRLYGEWLHLSQLSAGHHKIAVELISSDHRQLTQGGSPLRDEFDLVVPEGDGGHGGGGHHH